jgi:hypothetical protein
MPGSEAGPQKKTRSRRQRRDTVLIFDPKQEVPDPVLDAILKEWLVPCLVEQFIRERGITRESLLAHYRTL